MFHNLPLLGSQAFRIAPPLRKVLFSTGRSAQGVTLIKTGDDDRVTSASLLAVEAEEEEEDD